MWPNRTGGQDDGQGRAEYEKEEQKGKYVVGGILAVCGVIFVGWKWAEQNYVSAFSGSRHISQSKRRKKCEMVPGFGLCCETLQVAR